MHLGGLSGVASRPCADRHSDDRICVTHLVVGELLRTRITQKKPSPDRSALTRCAPASHNSIDEFCREGEVCIYGNPNRTFRIGDA